MALLPAARVSEDHLRAVLNAALASPGLSLDALRHRVGLSQVVFTAAILALKARRLVRVPHREGAGATRSRVYPSPGAVLPSRASGANPGPQQAQDTA